LYVLLLLVLLYNVVCWQAPARSGPVPKEQARVVGGCLSLREKIRCVGAEADAIDRMTANLRALRRELNGNHTERCT